MRFCWPLLLPTTVQRRFDRVKGSHLPILLYGSTGFAAVPQLFCNESILYVLTFLTLDSKIDADAMHRVFAMESSSLYNAFLLYYLLAMNSKTGQQKGVVMPHLYP